MKTSYDIVPKFRLNDSIETVSFSNFRQLDNNQISCIMDSAVSGLKDMEIL